MSIPAMIYLALTFIGFGLSWAKHGQPKTGTESAWSSLVAMITALGLLYWGGFFDAVR